MIINELYTQLSNLVEAIKANPEVYSQQDIMDTKDLIRGAQLDGNITNQEEYYLLEQLPTFGIVQEEPEEEVNIEEVHQNRVSGICDILDDNLGEKIYNEDDDKTIIKEEKKSFVDIMDEPLGNQFYNQEDEERSNFSDTVKKEKQKDGFAAFMEDCEDMGEQFYNQEDETRSDYSAVLKPKKTNAGFGAWLDNLDE